jgi:hypothetical protein
MLRIVVALLLAGALPAQTLSAVISDSRSHGTVGDGSLSLDEAIRIQNGTLSLGALSVAERLQISGSGTDLVEIRFMIDATAVITYERDLTPIGGPQNGNLAAIFVGEGTPTPILDVGPYAAGLPLRTNHAHVDNVVIRGGKVGIDLDTTLHLHPGEAAEIHDVHVHGQSEAGIRVRAAAMPGGQRTPVAIHDVEIEDAPIGLDLIDASVFGGVEVTSHHLHIKDCAVGILGTGTGTGSKSSAQFLHTSITGAETCVRVRNARLSDTEWFYRFVYGEMIGSQRGIDVVGSEIGNSIFHHHHLHVRGGPGASDHAITFGPRTARFDVHATDNIVEGNVLLEANRSTRRMFVHNSRFSNGSFEIDNEGVRPELLWNVFASAPVTVRPMNTVPVVFDQCEFVRSPVADQTAGMTTLNACFLSQSPLTNVVNNSPIPAPWIGRASVVPIDPHLGGIVDLAVDLRPGIGAVWLLGELVADPKTSDVPFRFYLKLATMVALPGIWRNQERLRLLVPLDPTLRGVALYAQPVAVPLAGQGYVPIFTFPRGDLFTVR